MHLPRASSAALLAVLSLSTLGRSVSAQITTTPTLGAPGQLTAGRDGVLYWVEQLDSKIGFRSADGTVGELTIPTASSHPFAIAAGLDGDIWFTESSKIGRYNPRALVTPFTEYPASAVGICAGPDGNMWFTDTSGNHVSKITSTGTITPYSIPTTSAVATHIVLGADGALWFTERDGNKVGRVTVSGTVTDYPLQTSNAGPLGIALGPDGNIWFCEHDANKIGRAVQGIFDVLITEFPLPNGNGGPRGIVAGPDGALWFTEEAKDRLGRITTAGVITEIPLPAGAVPDGVAVGTDGGLWFTEFGALKLGRCSVAADANRDGFTDIADVFYLINYLFAGGAAPK
jgi:virginiamycin B lyase